MKISPIYFGTESVRGILQGRKTQTRRVANFAATKQESGLDPLSRSLSAGDYCTGNPELGKALYSMRGSTWNQVTERLFCPYGQPGDHLWVREEYAERYDIDWTKDPERAKHYALYKADDPLRNKDPMNWHSWTSWKSGRFMPRVLSRITLEIAKVEVQRLQDITPKDCIAEGIEGGGPGKDVVPMNGWRGTFAEKWDLINARRGFPWIKDPFVWVLTFRRQRGASTLSSAAP